MESASLLTSAGVTGAVICGASTLAAAELGAADGEVAWAGGGSDGAAVSVFFWQATKALTRRTRERSRFASRRTEMFSMVKLGGSNLCRSLAQVSASVPRTKKSTTQLRKPARGF